MKNIDRLIFFVMLILMTSVNVSVIGQTKVTLSAMKLNAGIITPHLKETKEFYIRNFGFGVTFENEFYLLMHTPNHQAEISFLLPNHPSQQLVFQSPFQGSGIYLTIEVDDVDAEYKRIKVLGVPVIVDLRDEPWGDRHFAVKDPNGVGIDIVTYNKN
ncbi:MAG TPA: VOC family protein [Cyclobacteriaceae bacterium]